MKKIILSSVVLAAAVGCAERNGLNNRPLTSEVSVVASATDSETVLDGDLVKWESGDAIALRFASAEGVYTQNLTTSESGTSATFKGDIDNAVNTENGYAETGYAVYPASAADASGNVSYYLNPNVAALENGSFASGTNLASAAVSLVDLNTNGTTTAAFKNALSIVRFTLDDDVTQLSITASGNLAGKASLDFDEEGRLYVSEIKAGSKTITIIPQGDTFTAGTTYNVLVYPGTYTTLAALLTHTDDSTYSKDISGAFVFKPSEYYTFSFNTKYETSYQFTGAGVEFAADVDKIMTVYMSEGTVLHEEELTAKSGNLFQGNLPASVVAGVTGFAVFPSTAYDIATDKISYSLPVEVAASTVPAPLYSANLYVGIETATFNPVGLSRLSFDLPAGIKTVSVKSSTNFVGEAVMSVDAEGKLVAGMGDSNTILVKSEGVSGKYTAYVYSLAGADLDLTFTNMEGKEVTKTVQEEEISDDGEVPVGNLVFDTDASFSADGFENGGSVEF